MVVKTYLMDNWARRLKNIRGGKHKVVGEYVARYLAVRCQLPQQSRFRLRDRLTALQAAANTSAVAWALP